jgi:subtilisin family serine protease
VGLTHIATLVGWILPSTTAVAGPAKYAGDQTPRQIVVAVLDTGVDQTHPRLRSQMWINPGENGLDKNGRPKQKNRIDDDGNGFIDDVHGWDFVRNDSHIADPHGHGTHIAGIITLQSPQVRIMSLRYYGDSAAESSTAANQPDQTGPDQTGPDQTGRRLVHAIDYAVRSGAEIINISGGGAGKSPEEEEAIRKAWKAGILVIAAAGNEGQDLDQHPFYPASYDLPNIIAVVSTTAKLDRAMKTNFSSSQRLIHAIGENVVSYLPAGKIGRMSGTSQATARVSGIAVSVLTRWPRFQLGSYQIREHLLAAMVNVRGNRALDLAMVQKLGARKPGRIVDFDLNSVNRKLEMGPDRKMANIERNL